MEQIPPNVFTAISRASARRVTATESPSRSASTRSTSTVICTTRNTWSTAHTPATASSSSRAGTCAAWASTASARCHWPFEVTPVLRSAGTDVVGVGAHALWRRENAEDRFGLLGGELATGLPRTCLPVHPPPLRRRDEMAAPRTEEVAFVSLESLRGRRRCEWSPHRWPRPRGRDRR